MKLADFDALCKREWNKPRRGDVVSMRLTPGSYWELAGDVAANPGALRLRMLRVTQEEAEAVAAGLLLTRVPNPVTRTPVKVTVKPDGDRDTARVQVLGGTYRQAWRKAGA